ncbi:hypothetical protein ACHAXR_008032 [Thalassiosira sp. AJA248-18]
MESNARKDVLDKSAVSLTNSNLGDSNRSGVTSPGGGIQLPPISDDMKEANTMEEEHRMRREVPITTPASSQHADSSMNVLNSRVRESFIPPLPTPNHAAANHISPPTPMPPPIGIAGMSISTPPTTSSQSYESQTLAALYQSSRRSRNDTPTTPGATNMLPPTRYPPPPPIYAATSTDAGQSSSVLSAEQGARGGSNVASTTDVNKVSLQSSNASSNFNESWRSSMSSLMRTSSYANASFSSAYNARSSIASQGEPSRSTPASARPDRTVTGERPRRFAVLMDYKIEDRTPNRSLCESHDAVPIITTSTDVRRWPRHLQRPELNDYKMEDDLDRKSPTVMLTVPTLSGDSQEASARNSPSPSTGCMEDQLSSLQVRSRQEFELRREEDGIHEEEEESPMEYDKAQEIDNDGHSSGDEDDEADNDSKGRPKKKYKKRTSAAYHAEDPCYFTPQAPQTPGSCISTASFDILAHPSSHVSSMSHDGSPTNDTTIMLELLQRRADATALHEVNAEKDHEAGMLRMQAEYQQEQEIDSKVPAEEIHQDQVHRDQEPTQTQGHKEESPSERDQRIIRRKIQRLLLIRHCSTCPIPPTPLAERMRLPRLPLTFPTTDHCGTCDDGAPSIEGTSLRPSAVCPVTSHCAEGKDLCAHIRSCRLENCKYKKCLTSREVLGHYKSCKDILCQICGPVRSLDRRKNKGRGGGDRKQRSSDSSIETIDDEFWLNENK